MSGVFGYVIARAALISKVKGCFPPRLARLPVLTSPDNDISRHRLCAGGVVLLSSDKEGMSPVLSVVLPSIVYVSLARSLARSSPAMRTLSARLPLSRTLSWLAPLRLHPRRERRDRRG